MGNELRQIPLSVWRGVGFRDATKMSVFMFMDEYL